MSDMILDFRNSYENAEVGLRLMASPEQWEAFDEGSVDFAFMLSGACRPPLQSLLISRHPLIAVVPADHFLADRTSLKLGELDKEPLVIGTAHRWRGFRPILEREFSRLGLTMNIVGEGDDLPLLLQMVRSGLGLTFLDDSFTSTLPPGVRGISITDVETTVDIVLAWHPERLSSLAAKFVEIAENWRLA
jgi:DNA-binding transcriptional LysR family regulator